jgi:hypothetical protein
LGESKQVWFGFGRAMERHRKTSSRIKVIEEMLEKTGARS